MYERGGSDESQLFLARLYTNPKKSAPFSLESSRADVKHKRVLFREQCLVFNGVIKLIQKLDGGTQRPRGRIEFEMVNHVQ